MDTHGLDRSPLHLLHRAGQCAEEIFLARMARSITPRQLAVLITVAEEEGLSQTDITERTGIDRSTTADLVRRLLRRGLLQRRRSRQDARAYVLKLTDAGKRALDAADPLAKRVDARVLGVLPKERREEFIASLRTIIEALEIPNCGPQPIKTEARSLVEQPPISARSA
jgi:MarR family transcriptional regulator, temperature-dependent positive regulator of motility